MDPRVTTSTADLSKQFELSKQLYNEWLKLQPINERLNSLAKELANVSTRVGKESAAANAVDALNKKLQELTGAANFRPGAPPNLVVLGRLETLFRVIQGVDAAPTSQVVAAVPEVLRDSQTLVERWRAIESEDIPALNQQLQAAGIPKIELK